MSHLGEYALVKGKNIITLNGQVNDYATEVDRAAEQEIIRVIQAAYPEHAILAEESGEHRGNECVWIIDPLDGTTNFLHGFPVYAVSIALQVKGKLELGVVYDPLRDELFTVERGGVVTDFAFKDNYMESGNIITGNPKMHQVMY